MGGRARRGGERRRSEERVGVLLSLLLVAIGDLDGSNRGAKRGVSNGWWGHLGG
jgi:hypothetical protein